MMGRWRQQQQQPQQTGLVGVVFHHLSKHTLTATALPGLHIRDHNWQALSRPRHLLYLVLGKGCVFEAEHHRLAGCKRQVPSSGSEDMVG